MKRVHIFAPLFLLITLVGVESIGLTSTSGPRIANLARALVGEASLNPSLVFTVSNTNDNGTGSLRQAIIDANNNPGTDTIQFSIGSGAATISPATDLPSITGAVHIDATTQPGYSGTPLIQLSGGGTRSIGLNIAGGSSIVKGLIVNGFNNSGLRLDSSSNTVQGNYIGTNASGTAAIANNVGVNINSGLSNNIGGIAAAERNVISGNTADGVFINTGADNTGIRGNYIGTDLNGTAAVANTTGVSINSANDVIGGTTAVARNVISGNTTFGIYCSGPGLMATAGNQVQGNYIGTNALGTSALSNTYGVFINTPGNTIGGSASGAGNLVSGNSGAGIVITGAGNNIVQGNLIGTDKNGTAALANTGYGISINDSSNNTIGGSTPNTISGNTGSGIRILVDSGAAQGNVISGNYIGTDINGTAAIGNHDSGVRIEGASANIVQDCYGIAFNGSNGITVLSGTNNQLLRNSIFSNTGLGIDLGGDGVTPNDLGDGDAGPNNLQNFPVLTSAVTNGTSLTIQGNLNSTSNATFSVNFFASLSCDVSGSGEGQTYVGALQVATDSSGNATINTTLNISSAPGQIITATASTLSGATSEFSACRTVTSASNPSRPDIAWMRGGHKDGYIQQVVYSPNGQFVLSTGLDDGTIKFTRASDGMLVRTIPAFNGNAFSAIYSYGGTMIAGIGTESGSAVVKLFNAADGTLIRTVNGLTGAYAYVGFTLDDQMILVGGGNGGANGLAKLFKVSDGSLIRTFNGATGGVSFTPSALFFLSIDDSRAKLLRISDGAIIRYYEDIHGNRPVYSPNGETIFTTDGAGVKAYSAGLACQITTDGDGVPHYSGSGLFSSGGFSATSLSLSPDGQYIAAGGAQDFGAGLTPVVKLWRTADLPSSLSCPNSPPSVPSFNSLQTEPGNTLNNDFARVCFSPDSRFIASGAGYLGLWNVPSLTAARNFFNYKSPIAPLAISQDGQMVALAGSFETRLDLRNAANGSLLRSIQIGAGPTVISSVALSMDNQKVAVAASINGTGAIKLFQVSDGNPLLTINDNVTSIAFSPDGQSLAAGGAGTTSLYSATTGSLIRTFDSQPQTVSVRFSADGQRLITCSSKARIWQVTNNTAPLVDVTGGNFADLSPDGQILGVGYLTLNDGIIALYNASNGALLRTITVPSGAGEKRWIEAIAFSPTSQVVAAAGYTFVGFWQISNGGSIAFYEQEVNAGLVANPQATSIAYTPDGQRFAYGRWDATVVMANAPCSTFTISPTSQNFTSGGGSESVSVTTGASCSWTAVSDNPSFITITSGSSGSGNGTVNYSVAANNGAARIGTITIAGQTFTVTQDSGCTFMLSSTSQNFVAAGGTNSVNVTAGTGCPWTAVSNNAFITVNSGSPGSGNGTVNYTVAANTGPSRMGTMTIAGQTFTVTQDSGCTFMLSSTSQNFVSAGGMNSVDVSAGTGCSWTAVSNDGFITVNSGSSGSGNGTVAYTVAVNAGPVRMGTITIAGLTFTVTQDSSCTLMLDRDHQSFAGNGGTGVVTITASDAGCAWTASTISPFITITSGSSGIGNGSVQYSVSANAGSTIRNDTITVAGHTFTVYQGINFLDVPSTDLFYNEIGKLSARGVTLGCGAGNYCPASPVTRDQMAAFILRAKGEFNPPTPPSQRFSDVTPSNVFYNFIDRLAVLQITLGCSTDHLTYCPSDPVRREQMAAFLLRGLGEFNPPTPASQRFGDVPPENVFYNFIDRLAVLQITLGCTPDHLQYCPTDSVTRAQMAAFLVRAFNL